MLRTEAASPGGPTRSTTDGLSLKRYVAAGDRAYVIGVEDGSFAPMGWHIRGQMGGVWAHPIKLLAGYWFAIDRSWLPAASRFTTGPGYAQIQFPAIKGIQVTRTEFSPDGSPVVLVGLTLRNQETSTRTFHLTMDARSGLMGSYPWGLTTPNATQVNGKDLGSYDSSTGTLTFQEPGKQWHALVSASLPPARGATGDAFWGPMSPAQRSGYADFGNGMGGELSWNLTLGSGQDTTLWVAVAGSHTCRSEAEEALQHGLADPAGLLSAKVAGRQALLARTQVDLPDAALQAAFDWGKLNMADLRRTITDVQIRDSRQGTVYPPSVTIIPSLSGIGAGYPDYPWFFGTDGAYTSYPLAVSGQWETAMAHLRSIRDVSRAINGSTGKVVHEAVTDGSVYFGDVDDPGDTNETAQFAVAVDLLWRWSGNNSFRDEMYSFVDDGLHYVTSALDRDGDGWPEGFGMVEVPGMGSEKLDVTVYTWEALRALQRMAQSKGDSATAGWAAGKANAMQVAFDHTWWMSSGTLPLYADSLCDPGDEIAGGVCTRENEQLQQRHWINATPMEKALAPQAHASAALDTLESSIFTGPCGLYHTGVNGGPDGQGALKCWTLPASVMAVAEASYGRLGSKQALFYMDSIAKLLDVEMPGALPEIAPSPQYDPFVDFRDRAMVMQAWSSYGVQWPVIHDFLGIDPNIPGGHLTVVPQVPGSWPGLSVRNLRAGGADTGVSRYMAASARHTGSQYTTTVSAPAGWNLTIGHTLPAGAAVLSVTLDGARTPYITVDTLRGREIHVETSTDAPHTLVVTTR